MKEEELEKSIQVTARIIEPEMKMMLSWQIWDKGSLRTTEA